MNPHGTAHYGVGFGIVFQFHVGNSISNLGYYVLKSVGGHVGAVEEVWRKHPPAQGRNESFSETRMAGAKQMSFCGAVARALLIGVCESAQARRFRK